MSPEEKRDEIMTFVEGVGKGDTGGGKAFNGECRFCGKWGHRLADCREKTKQIEAKGKGKDNGGGAGKSGGWRIQYGNQNGLNGYQPKDLERGVRRKGMSGVIFL